MLVRDPISEETDSKEIAELPTKQEMEIFARRLGQSSHVEPSLDQLSELVKHLDKLELKLNLKPLSSLSDDVDEGIGNDSTTDFSKNLCKQFKARLNEIEMRVRQQVEVNDDDDVDEENSFSKSDSFVKSNYRSISNPKRNIYRSKDDKKHAERSEVAILQRNPLELNAYSGRLIIDLDAVEHNYKWLVEKSAPGEAGAVLKSDAYGLGIETIARTLWSVGCRTYFTAMFDEAKVLRETLPYDADIYVFNGVQNREHVVFCRKHRLVPMLNSLKEVAIWRDNGSLEGTSIDGLLPFGLNFETGMNRLGLTPSKLPMLPLNDPNFSPKLVMSQLACSLTPDHPMNQQQLQQFCAAAKLFPRSKASLCNTGGILMGDKDFLFDITRPGQSLYGIVPTSARESARGLRPVCTVEGRVIQVNQAEAGEFVGYDAKTRLSRPTIIASVGVGYGDIKFGSRGTTDPHRNAFINGKKVPQIGMTAMDCTQFDVTELGENGVKVNDFVELIGPNLPVEEVSENLGIYHLEILTSLGKRWQRIYTRGGHKNN